MRSGIQSIVYSLWQVEERAPALILYIFYEKLIEESLHPARALHLAQAWLRDATGEQLADTAEGMLELSTGRGWSACWNESPLTWTTARHRRELAEPSREPKKLSHREQRTALRAELGLPPE